MAHVTFCWELGAGTGHVARYRGLIADLLADRHRVSFVARDVDVARRVLAPLDVPLRPAPRAAVPAAALIRGPSTYAGLMWNCGFHAADALQARVLEWRAALGALRPDVVVVDHGPTALLAARTLGLRVFAAGSGFAVPPAADPLPPFRWWAPPDPATCAAEEARVMAHVAACLRYFGAPVLPTLAALVSPDTQCLMTFPELDHYPTRCGADYLGCADGPDYAVAPHWPDGAGPRVFAYLDGTLALDAVVRGLTAAGARVCLYGPHLDGAGRAALTGPAVTVMDSPVGLDRDAAPFELAVTNGNFNTVCRLLLRGTPQLVLSYDIEKYQVGRRVEALGAGLCVPRARVADLPRVISALLRQREYRRAAAHFAARYAASTAAAERHTLRARLGVADPVPMYGAEARN